MGDRKPTLREWIDARFPLSEIWNRNMAHYYAPKNFNFWYYFGSLALLVLVVQIVTGIVLAMHYTPNAELAFDSVEYIMRDVNWGWLVRFMHAVGATAFYVVVYLHMFRALLYGSYKPPRELLWIIGMLIFVLLMAEAFMGYLLPWGQMSYWGAQVITSLFSAIPVIGDDLELWLRGDYSVSNATLNRFYAWHVILIPLLLIALVWAHIVALHRVGSNNPDGIDVPTHTASTRPPRGAVPFHPYYTVKDLFGYGVFLTLFAAVVFFAPDLGGWSLEPENYIPADPLKTPPEIVPLWYFMPFYAVLRSIPNKLGGVIAMAASIVILFFLPWLDRNPIRSHRYRSPLFRAAIAVFVVTFFLLGYLGAQPPTPVRADLGFRIVELYFSFFVLLMIYSRPRSTRYMLMTFAAAAVVILFLDLLRTSQVPIGLMLRTWWIPAAYWAVFLLLPVYTRLNEPRPVPGEVRLK